MGFDPTLSALRALRSIARTGSVSATAAELGLTQSAVSRAIGNLERMVGLTLLQRAARPLKLTDEGAVVAAHAQTIDQTLHSLDDRLAALRRNQAGAVTIGAFGATASTRILPVALTLLARRHPGIAVHVQEATDAETLAELRRGHTDIAVLTDPGEGFETLDVARDALVALAPAGDALAHGAAVTPEELAGRAFIMPLGGSQPHILAWFGELAAGLRPAHRVLQTHSILAFVQAGLGCSIVAALSLPAATPGVVQLKLAGAPTRRIVFARRHGGAASRAAEVVWQALRRVRLEPERAQAETR